MGQTDTTPTKDRDAGDGVVRGTGRSRSEWFEAIDEWGGAERPYREIARWLTQHHRLSDWWAQKLTVEYQQARGVRAPGVRPDGSFTVTASKTVAVPVERLHAAFADPAVRERWLPGVVMTERTAQPGRSIRFDWGDGSTRVNVTFAAVGQARGQVGVEHQGLPDSATAEQTKAYWRERLASLAVELAARTDP